jgi:hypothetical protein
MTKNAQQLSATDQFEADALAAWDEYQSTGKHVISERIEVIFDDAWRKASRQNPIS